MVLYKCDKCLKEFNKKHNYEVHINRKFSCINNYIDKDLIIQNLTDENIELKNKEVQNRLLNNIELTNTIKTLEDKISKANYKKTKFFYNFNN